MKMFLCRTLLALCCFTISAVAQVNLTIGTLLPTQSVTITFEVTINSPLPAGVTSVTNQGTVSGANFVTVVTDDPETSFTNDVTITLLPADYDFGDAPDPLVATPGQYPTLLINNGARHIVPTTGAILYLGTLVPDIETNGLPNLTATGDNANNTADEDGVAFPLTLTSAKLENLAVTVAGLNGRLNAWIDWNRDGDWTDPGEQIRTNFAMTAGTAINVAIQVPSLTTSGTTFARFRLSTQTNLTPTGEAVDGEVEDYQVTLNRPPVGVIDSIERYPTQDAKVKVATLLANDSDPDGDTLSISAVTSPTGNNGTVTLDGAWIFYTPANGFLTADSFVYTVSDAKGGTASGTVNVTIKVDNAESNNKLSIQDLGGGTLRISFHGILNRTYTIQFTDNLNNPWQTIGTATANALGIYTFDHNSASPTRFYRSVYP